MKFPWANTLLLLLIVVELATGFLGLVVGGSEDWALFILVHRVAGYGILVVLVWKVRVVLLSLRRRRGPAPRAASLALAAALVASLGLGLAWSLAGPYEFAWFSGVSWHINVGAALVPILVWHAIHHTRGLPLSFWADRRSFLRLTGVAAVGLASWQLVELGTRLGGLGGASRRFTGSYEASSFSGNAFPLTSWLNDSPGHVDTSRWALSVGGAVDRELTLRYGDLEAAEGVTATLDCTGGWYSTQVWRGMPVARLIVLAGPTGSAASVTFTSVTGYHRRFSLEEATGYLLATHVGGDTLSHGHGFPVRLVAPGKRGFEWVKWVARIELNETSKWWQPPLPLQ